MPKTDLFTFMKDIRRSPSTAELHRRSVAEWKRRHRLFTHKGPDDWMALSMDECCLLLEGYQLTDTEKTDGVALMAGYCRLLDEAGLIHFGNTEWEACADLIQRLEH